MNDPKNIVSTPDDLLKNDIQNLRESKEFEEELKLEKKLKMRLINKDKEFNKLKNKKFYFIYQASLNSLFKASITQIFEASSAKEQ